MSPKQFVFNLHQPITFASADELAYLYTNDPVVLLTETGIYKRTNTQTEAIRSRKANDSDPMFEQDLDWAYREYVVRRLWVADEREGSANPEDTPIGNAPPQPATLYGQRMQLAQQRLPEALDRPISAKDEFVYLFNVIVALEWLPRPQYMRQLEWAFRRASDYLYDVTNGCMAFGQVVFADAEYLDCADIQLMASNRRLPRSWNSGLLEDQKYTPIRVGRGLWLRDRQVVVDWDEPEGWRSFIHEWGHYALRLKDDYLDVLPVRKSNGKLVPDPNSKPNDVLQKRALGIITLDRRPTSASIMATPQGNSELDYPLLIEQEPKLETALQKAYPNLDVDRLRAEFAGPGRLPLPLPRFRRVGAFARQWQSMELKIAMPFESKKGPIRGPQIRVKSDRTPKRNWELYVIKGDLDNPKHIIAQGEIDARATEKGFILLGAEEGDTIVLIGLVDGEPKAWMRTVKDAKMESAQAEWLAQLIQKKHSPDKEVSPSIIAPTLAAKYTQVSHDYPTLAKLLAHLNGEWKESKPATTPAMAISGKTASQGGKTSIRLGFGEMVPIGLSNDRRFVKVTIDADHEATVFPTAGGGPIQVKVQTTQGTLPTLPVVEPVTSLDGLVLIRVGNALFINDYSDGGGPGGSGSNLLPLPLIGGSANGDALIFFYCKDADSQSDRDTRIITTALRGRSVKFEPKYPGYEARSPVYSIASTKPLPNLVPTLVILTNSDDIANAEDVAVFRVQEDGTPTLLSTYLADNGTNVAVSLSDSESGKLVNPATPAGSRVECYVLGVKKPSNAQRQQQEELQTAAEPASGTQKGESVPSSPEAVAEQQ